METILPIVIILALLFYFGRIKIPKGLKPVPALEIEFPINYEAKILINNEELIDLPVDPKIIDECNQKKRNLSKSSQYLKYAKEGKSGFELLINMRDRLQLTEDSFTLNISYKKLSETKIVRSFGEIDYSIAYIHGGKLLLNSDIKEHNFKLDDQGEVNLQFTGLAEKVQKRIDRFS